MAPDPTSPDDPDAPDRPWLVWFDLACDDILALEPPAMTAALRRALAAAAIPIHEVQAPTRKAAIEKAFPKDDPANAFLHAHPAAGRCPTGPH